MTTPNQEPSLAPRTPAVTATPRVLQVAIVGCGRIARAHAEALSGDASVRLAAVCDTDIEAARRLAGECGARPFSSLAEMLGESNAGEALDGQSLDAVIVATPPTTHREVAQMCLRSGAHVLCEKPLATSPRDAEAMIEEARRCERALMMASKFRFVPTIQLLRERIGAGELGELLLCRVAFVSRVEMAGRMNAVRALAGGGVLMDNGPHALDLARFLAGPLHNVRASLWPQAQVLEVEDGVSLGFALADHALARGEAALSWSAASAGDIFVEVCGTRAGAVVRWGDYSRAQSFEAQWQHFAQVARGEREPLVSDEDALENARAIQAAYASLR